MRNDFPSAIFIFQNRPAFGFCFMSDFVWHVPSYFLLVFLEDFLLDFLTDFLGTLSPFFLALDKAIAMACLRLLTGFNFFPLCALPFLKSRISFSTSFCALLLYFLAMIF